MEIQNQMVDPQTDTGWEGVNYIPEFSTVDCGSFLLKKSMVMICIGMSFQF